MEGIQTHWEEVGKPKNTLFFWWEKRGNGYLFGQNGGKKCQFPIENYGWWEKMGGLVHPSWNSFNFEAPCFNLEVP